VLVYDHWPDGVLLHDSRLYENRLDGMAIIQRSDVFVGNPFSDRQPCLPNLGPCASVIANGIQTIPNVVKINSTEIYNNRKSGIYVVKTPTIIQEAIIIDNNE